jgi:hypothetical protein
MNRLNRARRIALAAVLLALAVGAAPASADPGTPLPTYDGAMSYPAITEPPSPEEYSWRVALNPGQSLKLDDPQHAEVDYEGGVTAMVIVPEPAHDANGAAVPTSLAVSEEDVITLIVHHRAGNPAAGGAPFAYPVSSGPAFIIGEGTVIVQGPLDESEIREARERIERENPAAQPSGAIATSPPERPVLFSTQCANAHYKPSEIVISCADARASFHAEEWIRWGSSSAEASGQFLHPDCAPSVPLVACRHNARDAATVKLYRPRLCPKQGRRYFTRLLLVDPEASDRSLRRIKLNYPCGYVQ